MRRYRKSRNVRNRTIVVVISAFAFTFMFVFGYAAFNTNISINVTGKVKMDADCVVNKVWEYEYENNKVYDLRIPCTGNYQIELWGASGGKGSADLANYKYPGGYGAYTKGIIHAKRNLRLYIYVGGKGSDSPYDNENVSLGGYNGGGTGGYDESQASGSDAAGGGGGATDIRLQNGLFDSFDSLKSRIMVASGGGGGVWKHEARTEGQNAGGLYVLGLNIGNHSTAITAVTDGTQTSGYKFGIGKDEECAAGSGPGYAGGGGGYYTGLGGKQGVGGTSFISGHDGCDAIDENSTESNIIHTGQSIHYLGLYFTDTVMIDGNGCKWTTEKTDDCTGMPTHDGLSNMSGNEGDGFAKIKLLSKG